MRHRCMGTMEYTDPQVSQMDDRSTTHHVVAIVRRTPLAAGTSSLTYLISPSLFKSMRRMSSAMLASSQGRPAACIKGHIRMSWMQYFNLNVSEILKDICAIRKNLDVVLHHRFTVKRGRLPHQWTLHRSRMARHTSKTPL